MSSLIEWKYFNINVSDPNNEGWQMDEVYLYNGSPLHIADYTPRTTEWELP
jgi:hypothetical protein